MTELANTELARQETSRPRRPAPRRRRPRTDPRALGWVVLVVLLVVWQLAGAQGWYSSPILPTPSEIGGRWWTLLATGQLWPAVASTLLHMLAGFALAAVIGTVVGVLMGRVRLLNGLLEPIVELIRPVPVVAIVPLLILFLGIGDSLKIFAVFLAAVFPVLLAAHAGITAVPITMRQTAETFRLGPVTATWEVYLPAALPSIVVGLRTALSLSVIIAVLSEMIAGNSGIGYLVVNAEQALDVTALYAQVITLALVGYLANFAIQFVQRRVLTWVPEARAGRR